MQKQEIFKKIGGIITELNDQYQYLSQNPENLNDLELELFLANSSFLADHIEILRKLNHISQPLPPREPEPVPVTTGPVTMPAEEPAEPAAPNGLPSLFSFVEETEDATFEYEQKPVSELFDRQLTAEEQAIIDRRNKAESADMLTDQDHHEPVESSPSIPALPEPVRVEPIAGVSGSVPDPSPAKVTIHDVIATQVSTSTVASRYSTNSVSDLKSIISLNDKLLFIKDLFNGYSLAYSEAIELVNRFDSLESADQFLRQNYAVKNKWESKPETVEKLYAILTRRFS